MKWGPAVGLSACMLFAGFFGGIAAEKHRAKRDAKPPADIMTEAEQLAALRFDVESLEVHRVRTQTSVETIAQNFFSQRDELKALRADLEIVRDAVHGLQKQEGQADGE